MDSVEKDLKKKSDRFYNILLVPEDDDKEVRKLHFTTKHVVFFCVALVFLVVALLVYSFILTGMLEGSNRRLADFQKEISELNETNQEMMEQNAALQEKITILSDTINDKVQKEAEIAQNYIPNGFPLRGTATFDEQAKKDADNAPVAVFQASRGTPIIGTANGKVVSITGDYLEGYVVKVDHGNGYFTIYKNSSNVKVKEGDEITTATVIFDVEAGCELFEYQIIKDDKYIDPFELIDIQG